MVPTKSAIKNTKLIELGIRLCLNIFHIGMPPIPKNITFKVYEELELYRNKITDIIGFNISAPIRDELRRNYGNR